MNFGEALQALKEGKKVTRAIWGGYWRLYPAAMIAMTGIQSQPDGTGIIEDIIVAHLKDGKAAPAQPYQPDLLAEDWQIVE